MATGEKLRNGVFSMPALLFLSSVLSSSRNSFVGPQNRVSRSWMSVKIGGADSRCSCAWTWVRKSFIVLM